MQRFFTAEVAEKRGDFVRTSIQYGKKYLLHFLLVAAPAALSLWFGKEFP